MPGTAKIDPQLATAVTRVDDLTWRMTLRPGVTLHDGSTLSAADVAGDLRAGPDRPRHALARGPDPVRSSGGGSGRWTR